MSIVQVIVVCSAPIAKTLSKPEPVQTGINVCHQGIPVWTGFTVHDFQVHKRKINFSSLEIEDIAITYVEHFSFLGITLDKYVNTNAHTNNISNKISR